MFRVEIDKSNSPATRLILVVEDESTQREFLSVTLEDQGYQVLQASDGLAALNLGAALDEVDLVVADVVMPEMDGLEFVRRLRERSAKDVAVLFLSAYSPEDVEEARPLLPKPVSADELLVAVASLLNA